MKKLTRITAFSPGLLCGAVLALLFCSATGATVLNPKPITPGTAPTGFFQLGNYGQIENATKSGQTVPYELNGTSESAVLIAKSNTAGYTPGVPSIQDGMRQNLSEFFSPIPEPGFYGVLAIGLAMTVWAAKFRPKQKI